MNWIKQSEQEPTIKDLPFITYGLKLSFFPKSKAHNDAIEFWSDSDWFDELDEQDRLEWVYWTPLIKPK